MASLTFNKEGGNWVAYFKAETDFALHIERDEAGVMSMEQSTTGGGYAVVEDFPARARYGRAFDYEFSALVYPKFIRIASTSEPTFAEVVSNGEITEIKAQSKEIEVTANGTTEVTPDAGFAYLSAVKVKTNVPTSGEGGGSGEESNMEYILYGKGTSAIVATYAQYMKIYSSAAGIKAIMPANAMSLETMSSMQAEMTAFGIDLNDKVIMQQVGTTVEMTLMQTLAQNGISAEDIAALPHITKEEFYTL